MIHDHVMVAGMGCTCIDIEVRNPRTHIHKGKALYTDYEIELKTTHPSFPLLNSKTRRRYSEFIWLSSNLGLPDVMMQGAPKLPGKQVIGRFKESFLQDRKDGLQRFLSRLLSVNVFLQEPALPLFLQTNLSVTEMDHYLKTRTPGAIKSLITRLHTISHKIVSKAYFRTISHEYPLTTRRQKKTSSGGRGWSSQYGDGYYTLPLSCKANGTSIDEDVRKRSATLNAGALPGGRLTLPSIPGSIDEHLPLNGSDYFTTTDDELEMEDTHPLSASWHGCERDHVDFLLDDYEVIPYKVMTQIEEKNKAEVAELGYLDLTNATTHSELNSYGSNSEQDCFDC